MDSDPLLTDASSFFDVLLAIRDASGIVSRPAFARDLRRIKEYRPPNFAAARQTVDEQAADNADVASIS
jgi:hypothetical protein